MFCIKRPVFVLIYILLFKREHTVLFGRHCAVQIETEIQVSRARRPSGTASSLASFEIRGEEGSVGLALWTLYRLTTYAISALFYMTRPRNFPHSVIKTITYSPWHHSLHLRIRTNCRGHTPSFLIYGVYPFHNPSWTRNNQGLIWRW